MKAKAIHFIFPNEILLSGGMVLGSGQVLAQNWQPFSGALGGSPNSPALVSAVAAWDTNVYVGGGFTSAGGTGANHFARWDGSQWHALGGGMSGVVFALAVSGSNLYAAGAFATNGVPANSVNKWNGSEWSGVGGLGGTVLALAADGTNLYAGGLNLGGGDIQRWNGSQWSPFAIVNGAVRAIAASNGVVYVGGDFSTVNAQPVNGVAEWNGNNWLSLGGGVGAPILPYVEALTIDGTNLYAGGPFTTAGGANANRIARWDGTSWKALGTGLAGSTLGSAATVNSIVIRDGEVFAGGAFMSAGGDRNIRHFARWDGTKWSALGPLPGFVNGTFQFLLTDQIGRTYGIEASPDLVNWVRVVSFTNLGGFTQFRDEAGTNLNRRFYRTVTP